MTTGVLQSATDGRGGFNIHTDGAAVKGELQFQTGDLNFHAEELTALGIAPDGTSAWFAGTGRTGEAFVAYVEDNGEPGIDDVFRLWTAGSEQAGGGGLSGGNIQIHR